MCNARLADAALQTHAQLDRDCRRLLDTAAEKFALSIRGYQRILRVARTLADLAASDTITPPQVAEALGLRGLDGAGAGYCDSATM